MLEHYTRHMGSQEKRRIWIEQDERDERSVSERNGIPDHI